MNNVTTLRNDTELFSIVRSKLTSCVVGDILDQMGHFHQILPQAIEPIDSAMVLVGRAMPVLITDVYGHQKKPFGLLTEALDQLSDGEVYIANGTRVDCAAWGEILTATARGRNSVGAVIDGYHRDTNGILAQDWPVFSRGSYSQDAGVRASVVDFRVPTSIGGVSVSPGDLIFGDRDGVVVVPRTIEAEVIERSLVKVDTEHVVRGAIRSGMTATEALATYGVL